ncbi:hypothetical protein [Catenisphaera adipataccumulans]|jgi:imidazolonepropionase-like amidohydrolase|uniref:Imidazolonepropionase-like amidohydrolase n=1 Tax=Catenisphaera adipataccumulans TaxID=700500 RepID=A0A7W8CVA9_9FIRM|nr:hypothetical protein [Catenisphaera adipataccumulans]MBB5182265.1 imidazolonepropionase-like amidohydrolase [Catenisphaera adipataccumulans]
MKATLIIKNIEHLYTCDEQFTIYDHAFVAMYHEKIIDIGEHSYKSWVDDATRVIDAKGEIVVPALIDCNYIGFRHVRLGDQLRYTGAALYAMKQNGILTLLSTHSSLQRQELTQDVFYRSRHCPLPIVSCLEDYQKAENERFLLSCNFGTPNSYIYSMHPVSFVLFNTCGVSCDKLLQAATSWPAEAFHLDDRGSLMIGKRGDLLVLQVPTLEHYFQTLGRPLIRRMIKNGIMFYPYWLIC